MGKVKYSPEMKEQTVKNALEKNKSVMHTAAALPSYKKATNPPYDPNAKVIIAAIIPDRTKVH